MKVGGHHHLVCLGQRLGSLQLQGHAYLIIIMEVTIEEEAEDQHEDAQGSIAVMIEESLRHEVNQSPQIEHKKHDDQIEHHEDGRRAYLVEPLRDGQRQAVKPAEDAQEKQRKAHHAKGYDQPFPRCRQRQNGPYMPGDIQDAQEGQYPKDKHPHKLHQLSRFCTLTGTKVRFFLVSTKKMPTFAI